MSPLAIFRTSRGPASITISTDADTDAHADTDAAALPGRLSDARAVQRRGGGGSNAVCPTARHGGIVFGQQSRELGARTVSRCN